MSTRGLTKQLSLPEDCTFLTFPRSDGRASQWPQSTQRIVDSEGQVNFMDPVPLDLPVAIKWRIQAGHSVAKSLGYPAGKTYVLAGWPDGYKMFDHNKGSAQAPRHDVYLMGGPSRFRSTPEFIPHAVWLFSDETLNNANCTCKYCAKTKTQKEITSRLAAQGVLPESLHSFAGQSSSPRRKPARPTRIRPYQSMYASIQKFPQPLRSRHLHSEVMPLDRAQDLRVNVAVGTEIPKWLRDGELVWCKLDYPIVGPNGSSIDYWPGFIIDWSLKTKTAPGPPPYETVQSNTYDVRLLAINLIMRISDEKTIPYQLSPPHNIPPLSSFPECMRNYDKAAIKDFNLVKPNGEPAAFEDALLPYAIALDLGAATSSSWSVTDEWHLTGISAPISRAPTTLQDALNNASQANDIRMPSSTLDTSPQKLSDDAIGAIIPGKFDQIRFQGMWWGAERIWVGDMIRTKLLRGQIAAHGAANIFAPSDDSTMQRGVFMQLTGLFVVESTTVTGEVINACRASGILYELVDPLWVETEPRAMNHPPPESSSAVISRYIPGRDIPPAPNGYKFRAILPEGYESVFSLEMISGRYYHGILGHPAVKPRLAVLMRRPLEERLNDPIFQAMVALNGLAPGFKNTMDPIRFCTSRKVLLAEADIEVHNRMQAYIHHFENGEDTVMEVGT